jgi:hypothetical protein
MIVLRIILPRQARDKHRESITKQISVFFADDSPMWEQFDSIKNTQPMNFWGHSGVTYAQPGEAEREKRLSLLRSHQIP